MLLSTPGLILHTTAHGETSVVVQVFTRMLGVRSYIIKGVRSRSARVKQNLLQPLTSLDMVVYDSAKSGLNHVKELALRHPVADADPSHYALRFFVTEVLYRTLREGEPMPELFDHVDAFVAHPSACNVRDYPIDFLLTLSLHLGIAPQDNHSEAEPYFDLEGGGYVGQAGVSTLGRELSVLLHAYLSDDTPAAVPLTARRQLIDALLLYYQMHIATFGEIASHEILHTILS